MQTHIQFLGALAMAAAYASPSRSTEVEMVNPPSLYDPVPNGYSHAVVVQQPARMAFVAGQGGEDQNGVLPAEFEAQVSQAYKNLVRLLDAIGADAQHVVKLNTYVVDHDQSKLAILTRHLVAVFGDHLPAQTLIPVPRLALDGMLFEVDATVVFNDGS